RSIEDVIPADSFQHLRERNCEIPDGGPFRSPLVRSAESLDLYNRNQMWISQLCRLWDEVLDEIIHQHFEIDLEERANAIYAVESLSLFRRRAGSMCLEARERRRRSSRGV